MSDNGELDRLKEENKLLHYHLLAVAARAIVGGVDLRTKYQTRESDRPSLIEAGLLISEIFPDIPLPKEFRTPLPDCNEFTNQMAMAFHASQRGH